MIESGLHIQTTLRAGEPVLRAQQPDPCAIVLVGATGDLAHRKLWPALFNLHREKKLSDRVAIIGTSRGRVSQEQLRTQAREAVDRFSRVKPGNDAQWKDFADRIDCICGPYEERGTFEGLKAKLADVHKARGTGGNSLYYLATPPSAFPSLLSGLSGAGLLPRARSEDERPWVRLVVEKPFGRDLASAQALNRALAEVLEERQIFRIDHYLGKETVQNLVVFRFGNSIFEPLWNRRHIDHVEITAAEELGVEGRGNFYDETGVVRDVVQNHLLQVLALVAMEPPISFGAEDIRDEKNKVFRALRPISGEDVAKHVVQAQYAGFLQEKGVKEGSRTPTFVAMRMFVDTWRWEGVPFYVRAGKRLKSRRTEVSIHFRAVPFCLFGESDVCQKLEPNVITFQIHPREGIALRIDSKVPGDDINLAGVKMDFDYQQTFQRQAPEAYERLLLDCTRGNGTLFSRRDSVEQAWRYITPINQALESGAVPMHEYSAGTPGPRESFELIQRDGRRWTEL